MATLFLGREVDHPERPPVAIKVIHDDLSEDWQFLRMFVDEALISVRIRHPNVVRVDELGEEDGVYFLVMEYVHGCSLAQLLSSMARRGRRMRPQIAVWIAAQVAAGLHAAHEMTGHDGALLGVVHRDVSPQNVLLGVDGSVKLLDFGIAKARGRAERTDAGVIKGKLRYMAPEQATGEAIDRRIDIYALGVVLWEMLTMRRMVDGRTELDVLRIVRAPRTVRPRTLVEEIDEQIDDAVMAALARDREDRPATAAAVETMLEATIRDPDVGPTHVAELLRLFALESVDEARRVIPSEVAAALPAPAGAEAPSEEALTREVRVEERTGVTKAMPVQPRREAVGAEVDPSAAAFPTFEEDADDDEVTIQDEGVAELLARLYGAEVNEPASPASSAPGSTVAGAARAELGDRPETATLSPSVVVAEPAQEPIGMPRVEAAPAVRAPAPTADDPPRRSPARLWLVVSLVTVVTFAIGAGLALAWLHLAR